MSPDAYEYPDALAAGAVRGRGAGLNPGNRYEAVRLHVLGEYLDEQARDADGDRPRPATTVIEDESRTIINRVPADSAAELGFGWTINPYRGCEHGCIYCYARPDHERLGYSCGLDFETKLIAKTNAPRLLRRELSSPKWCREPIVMAGVTDCYQPIEAEYRVTRGCMEVFAESRQPVSIVTKNRLILRDLDLLRELASHRAIHVAVSVTTLDNRLASKMEPRASSPAERLETIRALADAGVPTMVMVAPVIPGLTDKEMPAILTAAAEAGAQNAGYVMLRLPHQIKQLFIDWMTRHFPERAGHVESLIRQMHDGKLYDAQFGVRGRGLGAFAGQVHEMFKVFTRRHRLDRGMPTLSGESFRPPMSDGQMSLF